MGQDKKIIIIALVLVALVAGGYFFIVKKNPQFLQKVTASQTDAIKVKAEKYINDNLVAPGTNAKITAISEESELYKITVNVGGQDLTAFLSKDGKNFYPQVFNMDAPKSTASSSPAANAGNTATNAVATKSAIPQVDLFVMSYCPYGLQIEKGILPVVDLLGSKIKFNLEFVDYTMHGDKEIQENMLQYCIGQKYASKLSGYLKCFTEQGNSDTCLTQTGIDKAAITACISATDAKFKITETAKDQSTWKSGQYPIFQINQADNTKYNVAGSPTLVINGTTVSANRDPQSLLKLVCSAFSNAPEVCSQTLSTAAPAAGFGSGTGGAAANSSCGN